MHDLVLSDFNGASLRYDSRGKLKRPSPAPRTTYLLPLRGLPYGLPPRNTLNKQLNFRLRRKETHKAYLLHQHDHNWMKNSRHFLFTDFLDPVILAPFLHRPPTKTLFWSLSTFGHYHRFPWYATFENKTPAETFPKFPSIIHVTHRLDRNSPITVRLAWRKEGVNVTLVAVIGEFRSDLSITCKTDGNFGNASAGVLFFQSRVSRKTVVISLVCLN